MAVHFDGVPPSREVEGALIFVKLHKDFALHVVDVSTLDYLYEDAAASAKSCHRQQKLNATNQNSVKGASRAVCFPRIHRFLNTLQQVELASSTAHHTVTTKGRDFFQ